MRVSRSLFTIATLVGLIAVQLPAAHAAPSSAGPQLAQSGTVEGSPVLPTGLGVAATTSTAVAGQRDVPARHPDEEMFASAKQAANQGVAAVQRGTRGIDIVPAESESRLGLTTGVAASGTDDPGSSAPTARTAFYGNTECQGAGCWVPPDEGMSVSSAFIVEVNNDVISIFGKTGALKAGPFSLQAWFGVSNNDFVFDPVVKLRNGRFTIVALDCVNGLVGVECGQGESKILVSGTGANPVTGVHCNYTFPGSVGVRTWSDFPKLGMTANRSIVATNVFDVNGGFAQNLVTIITSATIEPGPSGACRRAAFEQWFNFTSSTGGLAFTQVPAQDYDADGANGFQIWSLHFGTSSNADVWKRSTTTANWTFYTLTTGSYSIPPDAPQPGTSARLNSGDDRLQGAEKRYGIVWLSHDTAIGGCPHGATANAHIINALSSDDPAQAPTAGPAPEIYYIERSQNVPDVRGCSNYDIYPMATVDGNGSMLFGFDRSGPSTFVEMRAGGWHWVQGIGASIQVQPSACACTDASGRWGDYGAAAVDPSNQDFVWIAEELLTADSFWTNGIGKVFWRPIPSTI